MSLSGEEQSAPMSLSGEEQNAPMTVSDIELDVVAAPRVSRRAAVVRVVVGLVAAGVVVGAVWAWLAPPIHAVVALTRDGDRVRGSLGDESDHLFLGAFLMAGLLGAVAVVAATLAWQWRAHRGPVMVGALAVGAMAAAGVATGVGAALVRWRYGVDRRRDGSGDARTPRALRHRGACGVLRAHAISDRHDDPVARGGGRARLRAVHARHEARRSGGLAARH